MELPEDYVERLRAVGSDTLAGLRALELSLRRLHPPMLPALREQLAPVHERLRASLSAFGAEARPTELAAFHEQLVEGSRHLQSALEHFLAPDPTQQGGAAAILQAMRLHARAQEALYPLRQVLPPLAGYFVEPGFAARPASLDPPTAEGLQVGLLRGAGAADGRGGFCLYVPEWYDASRPWPLVVALHGGFGSGEDFLFTWLREARGRGFLLLAPTSRGSTWSLDAPQVDARALFRMVAYVSEHWRVDPGHVLLTGLSDGASFSLLAGLAEGSPFTHLAPVSGVLHPANFALGNLARAGGRPIRLVHGSLDWMFPVGLARAAARQLEEAGAALVFREIEDLSHTYPREENAPILAWFDATLGEPGRAG